MLFKKLWEDEKIPEDWSRGVIMLSSLEKRVKPLIVLIIEAFNIISTASKLLHMIVILLRAKT